MTAAPALRPAVFLDRDGVLNRAVIRSGRPHPPASLEELEIVPQARASLQRLKEAGFVLIVLTNQPDVARGVTPLALVKAPPLQPPPPELWQGNLPEVEPFLSLLALPAIPGVRRDSVTATSSPHLILVAPSRSRLTARSGRRRPCGPANGRESVTYV